MCTLSANLLEFEIKPEALLERITEFIRCFYRSSYSQRISLTQCLCNEMGPIIPYICEAIKEIFGNEPLFIPVTSPCLIFGDIHGNLADLNYIDNRFRNDTYKRFKFIFLGDFVDRGSQSIEVILFLFAHKLVFPKQFILIRGNHETRSVNRYYTFLEECQSKFGPDIGEKIWEIINCTFDYMPIAAVVDNRIFCCHGGVPRFIEKIDILEKIYKKPISNVVFNINDPKISIIFEILWNDPLDSFGQFFTTRFKLIEGQYFYPNVVRRCGFFFTEDAVKQFLQINRFKMVIRAHECIKNGFKFHFDQRVVTIFSSSNYCGIRNTTSFVQIDNCKVKPLALRIPK